MTDYEDLTFLDPAEVPPPAADLGTVKAVGRRKTRNRRLAAIGGPAALVVAALVAVAVTVPTSSGSANRVVPASPTAAVTSTGASASPTASATTSAPPDVQDLAVPSDVRTQLLQAYASLRGVDVAQYAGFVPGELYYAHVRATDTYWALGTVQAAQNADAQTSVDLQDGEDQAVFHRVGTGGAWTAVLVGVPALCQGLAPDAVLATWQMKTNDAGCAGYPIGLDLREGTDNVTSSEPFVTRSGTLLAPLATQADEVQLQVRTAATAFVVDVADYRLQSVDANGQKHVEQCTQDTGAPAVQRVEPLTTGSVTLRCAAPAGHAGGLTFQYAPGGTVVGEWIGQ